MIYKNIIHITEHRGFSINIYAYEDAESPRTNFDNLGTMYTRHRNYQPEEDFNEHFNVEEVFDGQFGVFKKSFLNEYVALPLFLYDHGGQSVNTTGFSCRWDTSQLGIIAVSITNILKEYGWKRLTADRRKKIESYLDEEVKTYNSWLNNDVYGYNITDNATEDEIDSCWGYYGDEEQEYIIKEGKSFIDNHIQRQSKQSIKNMIDNIKKYGKQLLIPFTEFPDMISEPLP